MFEGRILVRVEDPSWPDKCFDPDPGVGQLMVGGLLGWSTSTATGDWMGHRMAVSNTPRDHRCWASIMVRIDCPVMHVVAAWGV